MLKIKKAVYLSDYKIKIHFSDGKVKVVDFNDWITIGTGYFEPLKDIEYFKKFSLDEFDYTICWPNGADFCPDTLYQVGKEVKISRKPVKKRKSRKKIAV